MFKLKVTKQSLNRVLRDLIKSRMIKQIKDEHDTRKKNLFLDKEGKVFFQTVYNTQKKRIFNALKNSNADSVIKFKEVLKKIIKARKKYNVHDEENKFKNGDKVLIQECKPFSKLKKFQVIGETK